MLLDDLLTTLQEPLLGWTPTLRQTQKNCSWVTKSSITQDLSFRSD